MRRICGGDSCFRQFVSGPEGVATQQAITESISLQLIRDTKTHVTIYTDRSATGGTTAGGAAMVATVGDPANPVIIHTSKARGAEVTSSNEKERSPALGSRLGKSQLPH